MRQYSIDETEELKLRFQALMAYEKKLLAYAEEIKIINSGKKDTIKAIAEKLEGSSIAVRSAFAEYMEAMQEKEKYAEKEEVLAMLMTGDFLK